MPKKDLAIIGNGMATCRLLDELVERGARQRYDITVFGEETGGAYNRILLSKVLGGREPEAIESNRRAGTRRTASSSFLDGPSSNSTPRRAFCTRTAVTQRYDVAVLATGSKPLVPPLVGMTHETDVEAGVFVYRTMDDCLRMRAAGAPATPPWSWAAACSASRPPRC